MNFISRRQANPTVADSQNEVVRRHRPDYLIILFVAILMLLGLVVLYAISPARAELDTGADLSQNAFMYRQLLYLLIALVAAGITAALPFRLWQKYESKFLLIALGLCILLAPLGLVHAPLALCVGDACRWYSVGPMAFQPAELLKFALLLFLGSFLASRIRAGKLNSLHETLLPLGALLVVISIFIIGIERDMGTGITIFSIVAAMLFVGGLKKKYFLYALGASLALGVLFIVTSSHRIERVITFFSPSQAGANDYHIQQALIAVGSGGLTGKGLGNSVQAFGYLPEAVNDSIFAILGEKFGFIGLVVVLVIFGALLVRVLKVMDNVPNMYQRLLVAGVFGWLASHIIVNVGAMLGIFPLTGITLPFVSFGGTSLLFTMCALGLVIHISRYTTHQGKGGESNHEDSRSGRRIGGSRYSRTRSLERAQASR